MNENDLMNDPMYRKEFEIVAKSLGEKYGPQAKALLDKIKQRKEISVRESNNH